MPLVSDHLKSDFLKNPFNTGHDISYCPFNYPSIYWPNLRVFLMQANRTKYLNYNCFIFHSTMEPKNQSIK